mgnify:CR=1 FL=1
MIKVENLKLSFEKNEVLKGINFKIEKGQVISIIGPSGSGKSTFLRSLNFLETASSGTITFGNETFDLSKINKKDIKVTKNIYRTKKNNCGENILLYLPLLEWSERILEVIFSKKQLQS